MPRSMLIAVVLFVHLLWCVWIVLGWTITRGRRLLRNVHIASLIYAVLIESLPWPPCPLSVLENWLQVRAGSRPARAPFLVRLLDAIVYPRLPVWLVVGGAVAVCFFILGIYLWRYRRRSSNGPW